MRASVIEVEYGEKCQIAILIIEGGTHVPGTSFRVPGTATAFQRCYKVFFVP